MPVRLNVAAGFLHGEQIAIPCRAPPGIANGQDDNLACDVRHAASAVPAPRASSAFLSLPTWGSRGRWVMFELASLAGEVSSEGPLLVGLAVACPQLGQRTVGGASAGHVQAQPGLQRRYASRSGWSRTAETGMLALTISSPQAQDDDCEHALTVSLNKCRVKRAAGALLRLSLAVLRPLATTCGYAWKTQGRSRRVRRNTGPARRQRAPCPSPPDTPGNGAHARALPRPRQMILCRHRSVTRTASCPRFLGTPSAIA